ncbi:Alanyl-tRNA synthetase [hydrothermal vent metagenome]|uniref:Alanine--tRNA ligase n=1 Tax=hydrothermal vent metagenome TaxID=652676 RepID=A0A3B1A397_9ZZZZ
MTSSAELRKAFLSFFEAKDHTIVASSPLVPGNDPTLLFTNAGMVQFKDTFIGTDPRPYVRAVSTQRCVRAGGKHNDLENVGYTARHHTFFEMLGNFSFGDYFKEDAIKYAWEFLTQVLKIPVEKLWVTVFDEDGEAEDIWLNKMNIDPSRLTRIGAKDNFWAMGDTGPCGPCTEIFYDHGEDIAGGPPGTPDEDGDRYIEIWNLVFMQYDRDKTGNLKPLKRPCVDTGMGLERLAAVMQHVHNNYEIDLFQNLITAIAKITKVDDLTNNSLRVIADHIRACSFLIVDGVIPSNEGRGYVLRRIIRRAIRHGHKLGMRNSFFYKIIPALVSEMSEAFPELGKSKAIVEKVLKKEEQDFAKTLDQGMVILEAAILGLKDKTVSGDIIFKLYDTYGFPSDLTADIARERGLNTDMAGFDMLMKQQQSRSKSSNKFAMDYGNDLTLEGQTEFVGYEGLTNSATVSQLFFDGVETNELSSGQQGLLIVEHTPFYAESGGQAGDVGEMHNSTVSLEVLDTQKNSNVFTHIVAVDKGEVSVGDKLQLSVNSAARQATAYNHSATHLLHAALRQVLGEHVTQKGSEVNLKRLRFDFSHFEAISAEQLQKIETLVNEHIRQNHVVETNIMAQDEAVVSGAMALFGEKYGDKVRVLRMGDFSIELCGGTHVSHTGDIGVFKILSEFGIAAGVRRIEAVAGQKALNYINQGEAKLSHIADLLKANRDDVDKKVESILDNNRKLEKEVERLKNKLASSAGSDIAGQALEVDGIKVLATKLDNTDVKGLRTTLDQVKNKLGSAVVILATVDGDKISLVAGVTDDKTAVIKAGDLVKMVAEQVGGKGGGRADMAQAGGNDPSKLDSALKSVPKWVKSILNKD